jgi:hypothetical protein
MYTLKNAFYTGKKKNLEGSREVYIHLKDNDLTNLSTLRASFFLSV